MSECTCQGMCQDLEVESRYGTQPGRHFREPQKPPPRHSAAAQTPSAEQRKAVYLCPASPDPGVNACGPFPQGINTT